MSEADSVDLPSAPARKPWSDRWLGLIIPVGSGLRLGDRRPTAAHLPRYLVAPSEIASTWWQLAISGELFVHIGASLFRQMFGFVIGATCGVLVGLLAGVFRPVERFYEPLISLIYPVPKVAILPLIFVWFGLGSLSKIVVMTISIFFPTYIAAFYGAAASTRSMFGRL